MLRYRKRAAAGNKVHEKRSTLVASLSKLFATTNVIIAVPAHKRVRQFERSALLPLLPMQIMHLG